MIEKCKEILSLYDELQEELEGDILALDINKNYGVLNIHVYKVETFIKIVKDSNCNYHYRKWDVENSDQDYLFTTELENMNIFVLVFEKEKEYIINELKE